eukprot:1157864-Pelagomonas_calceolata.AAC.5
MHTSKPDQNPYQALTELPNTHGVHKAHEGVSQRDEDGCAKQKWQEQDISLLPYNMPSRLTSRCNANSNDQCAQTGRLAVMWTWPSCRMHSATIWMVHKRPLCKSQPGTELSQLFLVCMFAKLKC